MNIIEVFQSFQTQEQAIEYLEKVRWGGEPSCPYCGSLNSGRHASADRKMPRWQCRDCGRAFSVTVGTLFHGTHIPLRDWFLVLALMLNAKKSASAYQIARDLGKRRPTVWSMMQRIRTAMANDPAQEKLLYGIVEADETYVGGKPRKGNKRDDDKPNKRGRGRIENGICRFAALVCRSHSMKKLWYGDNLTIMQQMRKHSVDLIYLDPPFKSDANYNLLYKNMTGKPVPEQAEAFFDTWELDAAKLEAARTMPVLMREYGVDDYYVEFWRMWMQALRNTQPELLAYLIYMTQRLLHMKSILRPTGSIYLHCDPAASHYIKVMMDAIFGHRNFRNEIIWKRTGSHGGSKRWGPVHDTILYYTASDNYTWNRVFQDYDPKYLENFYRFTDERGRYRLVTLTGAGIRTGDSGKPWRGVDPSDSGRHWAVPKAALEAAYPDRDLSDLTTQEKLDLLDEAGLIYWPTRGSVPQQKRYSDENPGVGIQDIITDIGPISSQSRERLGYPTQKPVPLLERIISASTNPGDVVFDPFCGCGTTIYAAEKTGREWIGCDVAILAIKLIREVLAERYRLVEGVHFEVDGIPVSVEQAEELARRDPFQFQHWFVERVGGFPMQKKVADRGIDGRIYFETRGDLGEMVLSVKSGRLRPTDIRDLRGVMERERAAFAGFLSLQEPTKAMRTEAADAGVFEYNGISYPRLQLLTVRDVLEDKKEFHIPTRVNTRITSGQQSLPL